MNILRQGGPLFIVSFGLSAVILTGSIDISSDGMMSLCGICSVMLANVITRGGGWMSLLLGVAIGLLFGTLCKAPFIPGDIRHVYDLPGDRSDHFRRCRTEYHVSGL